MSSRRQIRRMKREDECWAIHLSDKESSSIRTNVSAGFCLVFSSCRLLEQEVKVKPEREKFIHMAALTDLQRRLAVWTFMRSKGSAASCNVKDILIVPFAWSHINKSNQCSHRPDWGVALMYLNNRQDQGDVCPTVDRTTQTVQVNHDSFFYEFFNFLANCEDWPRRGLELSIGSEISDFSSSVNKQN